MGAAIGGVRPGLEVPGYGNEVPSGLMAGVVGVRPGRKARANANEVPPGLGTRAGACPVGLNPGGVSFP